MDSTHRRGFFGRLAGAAATLGLPFAAAPAAARQAVPDDWIQQVKGTHRCLFDFPSHNHGWGLVHVLNYVNTYERAYKTTAGQVGAVGTFYGIGPGASIALAFSDAMWAKYGLGDYHGLKDAGGTPYTRNVFHRPTKDDAHLLAQGAEVPPFAAFGQMFPTAGIEALQQRGTTFLICANALGAWSMELEARGKGKAPEIQRELQANLLPGVIVVPAMVIAIDKAQKAGIAYNRQ
jgi:intracellular sulfur oxidation DsrE/DsrF family protein